MNSEADSIKDSFRQLDQLSASILDMLDQFSDAQTLVPQRMS